jgi:hypothetical protein
MHDEGASMPMTAKVILEQREHGRRSIPIREWDAEDAGRLVDDQQQVVLEEDLKLAKLEGACVTSGAAGSIHPDTNHVAFTETPRRLLQPDFDVVDEDLTSLERRGHAPPGTKSLR